MGSQAPRLRFAEPDVTVVADLAEARGPAQNHVDVSEWEEQPAEDAVRNDAERTPGQQDLDVFETEDQHGGRRSRPPVPSGVRC